MSNKVTAEFIEKNHPLVMELMLQRQQEQTGKSDWSVFKEWISACAAGFDWKLTPEGADPWDDALILGNFAPLYALHPEWSEPKPTEPKPLIDGSKLIELLNKAKVDSKESKRTGDYRIGLDKAITIVQDMIYDNKKPE